MENQLDRIGARTKSRSPFPWLGIIRWNCLHIKKKSLSKIYWPRPRWAAGLVRLQGLPLEFTWCQAVVLHAALHFTKK